MLKRLKSASGMGVFKDFHARDEIANFKKLNLLYGFNGSGKTTLTRIFRSLEKGEICAELPQNGCFEIEFDDGTVISNDRNLDAIKNKIAVFNADFVEENFQWKAGSARPVFFIGKDQAEAGKKLQEAELKGEQLLIKTTAAEDARVKAEKAFSSFKTATGRAIGEQIANRNFNARSLDRAFADSAPNPNDLLEDQVRKELRSLILKDAPTPKVPESKPFSGFREFVEQARTCLSETVGTVALRELSDHPSMVGWVKTGRSYHREKSINNCLFCGNLIESERMQALDAAIDDRFDRIAAKTNELIERGKMLQSQILAARTSVPSRNDLVGNQSGFDEIIQTYRAALDEIVGALAPFEKALARKAQAPNTAIGLVNCCEIADATRMENTTTEALLKINNRIAAHNTAHDDFAKTQQVARNKLLKHYLSDARNEYRRLELQFKAADEQATKDRLASTDHSKQIDDLTQRLRDHGPAADIINALIKAYLRHDDIEITAQDDGFQLRRRGAEVATNLSEGEKTAITLCYFLSSLGSDGRQLKDLIVVVDDPISSLDSHALNYASSVLKGHLQEAKQLIILTHNVNFMNECRKWLRRKVDEGSAALLFLDLKATDGARWSEITNLPKLLREYDSEYHYLFSLVMKFAESEDGLNEERLFLMPNAMRKVSDVFFAFKRPGNHGLAAKIDTLAQEAETLGLDAARLRAIDRLVQVESHGDSLDDLITFSSMTVEEAHETAKALMELIQKLDGDHYKRISRQCR